MWLKNYLIDLKKICKKNISKTLAVGVETEWESGQMTKRPRWRSAAQEVRAQEVAECQNHKNYVSVNFSSRNPYSMFISNGL